jgi:formate dehydrogenase subunit delta
MSSQLGHLVKMANQIALNFGEQRDLQLASHKTAEHLQKFWTRDMREKLAEHVSGGAQDVSPAVLSALGRKS